MKMTEKATRGQTIVSETAPNRNSAQTNHKEGLMGRKMAGHCTDVSHSLTGAGDVQTYSNGGGKGKSSY